MTDKNEKTNLEEEYQNDRKAIDAFIKEMGRAIAVALADELKRHKIAPPPDSKEIELILKDIRAFGKVMKIIKLHYDLFPSVAAYDGMISTLTHAQKLHDVSRN